MRQIIQMAVVRCDNKCITPKTSSHSLLWTADAMGVKVSSMLLLLYLTLGLKTAGQEEEIPTVSLLRPARKEKRGGSEVLEDGNQLPLLHSIIHRHREVQPHINPRACLHSPSIFVYCTASPELLHRGWCWPVMLARKEAGGSEPGVVQVGHQLQEFSLGFAEFRFGVHLLPLKSATAAHDLPERRPHSQNITPKHWSWWVNIYGLTTLSTSTNTWLLLSRWMFNTMISTQALSVFL